MSEHTPMEPGADPFALDPDQLRTWRQLGRDADSCTRCALHEGRTKVVFGEGAEDAELVVLGDAPSQHEDILGKPFTGGAGNLLTNALLDVGLSREQVYVTTLVKCHPPQSRDPEPAELRACSGYLAEQLAHVRPDVIVTLGALTTRVLLGRDLPLEKIAGHRFDWFGATVVPTHHPADALRGDNQALAALRRDLRTAVAVLEGRITTGAEVAEAQRRRVEEGRDGARRQEAGTS